MRIMDQQLIVKSKLLYVLVVCYPIWAHTRNSRKISVQEHFSKHYVLKFQFWWILPLLSLFEDELYSDSFRGFPGSDKCQHRKWALAHEGPRVTQKFLSGVIHQKLRLERAHHAGYLLAGVRGVFMHFLIDPDISLHWFVLYRYT